MSAIFFEAVKKVLSSTVYREGTVATVLRGPLKGCRYRVTKNSGLAPVLGRWEPAAQTAYSSFVKPGSVVYDLGANAGLHSLLFSRLTGPSGKVYAFEPMPSNLEDIRSIAELNGARNIEIVEKAASSRTGEAVFKIGKHDKQGSLVGIGCETGEEITVRTAALDDLISAGLPAPHFVKIDIEGAEADALEGFSGKIGLTDPVFFIDLHTPEQDVRVGRFFKARGYRLFRLNTGPRRAGKPWSEINNLEAGWPQPDGVWGTVIAVKP